MNKYAKTLLICCSTLGLSLFTVDNVRASSFSSTEIFTRDAIVEDASITFEPFLAINLENTSILEQERDITVTTDGDLTLITDSVIDFEPVASEPTLGLDFTPILENDGNITIDVGGNLNILGLLTTSENGGTITVSAGSIQLTADPLSTSESGITISEGEITLENTENNNIPGNGGVITVDSGGTITIDSGSLTITSVPESSSLPSLLLIGTLGSFLTIKHKFKFFA